MERVANDVLAATAERLRDVLLRFPCVALEGVRWSALCKAFSERFPEQSNVLKLLSAASLANSWSESIVYEEDTNEDDGLFRCRGVCSLAQCQSGQLACWPVLLQRLVDIVRNHGNLQQTTALDAQHELDAFENTTFGSDCEVAGVLLAQLKTLLRQHWDREFEDRAMGFFNEAGCYVVIKKMKHLITELLRWRRRRRTLTRNRSEYCDIDAAIETPVMLATLQRHNDMILCCPIAEHPSERPCSLPCSTEVDTTQHGDISHQSRSHDEAANVALAVGSQTNCREPALGMTLDDMEKMTNRLRIENAELKKKLRFDTELLKKENRSLRIENVELKKRLYFSSQYAPHAEQSQIPMNAMWMSPGMLTQVVCGNMQTSSFASSGQVSPGPGSATPIPQGFCYAMQVPQGMMSPNSPQWCTTLIAVPFTGGGSSVATTMTPCSDSNLTSDTASPERPHSEPADSTQLQTLSSKGDDRWVCIPSGIVERCASQFEACEGMEEEEDDNADSWVNTACNSQVTAETHTMIPSGIVERFKSHFEGHDGTTAIEIRTPSESDCSEPEPQIESAATFVIGDCVMVKPTVQNPKYNWGDVTHGDHGIIQSIDEDGNLHIDFPSQQAWVADSADMQLYKQP